MNPLSHSRLFPVLLFVSCIFAGCATQPPVESVEQFIKDRSREWTDAYVSGNPGVLEEILAADFVGTSTKGLRYTRQDAIRDVKDGPAFFASNRLSKIEVKVYGNTALAFGIDLMKLKSNPTVEEAAVWTDTWLMRNGKWQVVASHESQLPAASVR